MMKEGRGRSSSGGNLLFSKTVDNWYFEVNTLVEDGSSLFVDQNYHGNALENRKNVVYVRPVAVWQSGAWSAAAAIESNSSTTPTAIRIRAGAGSTSQTAPATG